MSEKEDRDHSDMTQGTKSQLLNVSTQRSEKQHTGGRVRLYSESEVSSQVSRRDDTEFQDGVAPMEESGGEGAPFRGRSHSAPAALWAAKKYGRQLRRMSDEFDTWLDRGELKKGISPGVAKQKQVSRGWFSFLWSPKEEEGRE